MKILRYDRRMGKVIVDAGGEAYPVSLSVKVKLIGLKEMSEFLGMTPEQVRNAIAAPGSPPLRHLVVGGEIRVQKSDFNLWLQLCTQHEYHYVRVAGEEPKQLPVASSQLSVPDGPTPQLATDK